MTLLGLNKKLIIIVLVILNLITALCLVRSNWLNNLWKREAINYSKFAAGLWAVSDFNKGKLKKLKLRIEDEPNLNINKDIVFDGDFVVTEWVGYTDSFLSLRGLNSPDIQVARNVVNVYNLRMKKCYENQAKYKKLLADDMYNWNENILKTKSK